MNNGFHIDKSGTQQWHQNGLLHREDGPALIRSNGTKLWYIKGKKLAELDFQNILIRKNLHLVL